eukprot:12188736-Prorocentrum_lima.AAC.1
MGWGCPPGAGKCCHAAVPRPGDPAGPLASGALVEVAGGRGLGTPIRGGGLGGKSVAGVEGGA